MPDLLADLRALIVLAGGDDTQALLASALAALELHCPYDCAVLLDHRQEALRPRAWRGRLADGDRLAALVVPLASRPAVAAAMRERRPLLMSGYDHQHGEGDVLAGAVDLPAGHACLLLPLASGPRTPAALAIDRSASGPWRADEVALAGAFGQLLALALRIEKQAQALERLRRELDERGRVPARAGGLAMPALLAGSRAPAMRNAVLLARQVAGADSPVLLGGETGVGKEVLARAIHTWSARSEGPFVAVNCAALPGALVESELFGHVAGAFTGATADRPGRFAMADGGTLLLDEVGELSPPAQATLLRVLQEGAFEAVGSDRTQRIDVRVIAATNRDLEAAVADGRFRADLYWRLAVFPIHLPPLRERREDILPLAEAWLAAAHAASGRGPWTLAPALAARLAAYAWPGNVRELLNCLERATIVCPRGELVADHLPLRRAVVAPAAADGGTLAEAQRAAITRALRRTRGKLYGADGAAAALGLKPSTLQSRMKKLGIARLPA